MGVITGNINNFLKDEWDNAKPSSENPVHPKGEMVTKGHLNWMVLQPQQKSEIKHMSKG